MVSQRRIAIYIDLIFCCVVLPLVLSIIPLEKMFVSSRVFTVIMVLYMYLIYALYRRVRVPRLIMKRKFGKVVLFFSLMLGMTWLLAHFPLTDDFIMRLPDGEIPRVSAHRRQRVWFIFLVVSGFSLVIDLTFELFRQVIARKEVEEAKNRAELALYKAQIDPHFMFNSLNAIYGMIVSGSDRTEEAFVKFSDMLKYAYDHTGKDLVEVDRELEYIGNYIDFQSLRYGGHTVVDWECVVEDHSAMIPPMILITFVENAFKYGASSSRDCRISIRTEVRGGGILFETENRIMRRPPAGNAGIGIENCRRRLELLYQDRFSLDISEDEDVFGIRLSVAL